MTEKRVVLQEDLGMVNAMRYAASATAHNSATLAAALAAIGATPSTLYLEPATWTITSPATVPATCTLELAAGAVLAISGGVTLTLGNPILSAAPLIQVFSGTGNVVFSPASQTPLFPQWWGATGNGTTDDTLAVQAALTSCAASGFDGQVFLPAGSYKITAQLNVGTYTRVVGDGNATVLLKAFSGYLIDVQSFSSLEHFKITGQGATYAGAGVLISTGTLAGNGGHQVLSHLTIWETEAANIEYSAAGVGYASTIVNCDLRVYGDLVPSIKLPDDGSAPANRHILNCRNAGGEILDTGQCQNTTIMGCLTGSASPNGGILFSGINPLKCIVVGNRFATGGGTMIVTGNDHVFAANIFAGPVSLGPLCNNVRFDSSNIIVGTLQPDDTLKSLFADNTVRTWIPNWYGATTNPILGDGTLVGRYTTINRRRLIEITLIIGSTTVLPTGVWTFGAPGPASTSDATAFTGNAVTYIGSGMMTDVPGVHYLAAPYIQPGSETVYVAAHLQGWTVKEDVPFAWAAGCAMYLSLSYDI